MGRPRASNYVRMKKAESDLDEYKKILAQLRAERREAEAEGELSVELIDSIRKAEKDVAGLQARYSAELAKWNGA